jgi:hypothetical protein
MSRDEAPDCMYSYIQLLLIEGCRVVSAADLCGRNLGFLDRSRYFLSSSSSVVLARLSGLHSRPTTSQKIW